MSTPADPLVQYWQPDPDHPRWARNIGMLSGTEGHCADDDVLERWRHLASWVDEVEERWT